MAKDMKVIFARNKEELAKLIPLIEEGKIIWGGVRPTKEQLDKMPSEGGENG